MMNMSEIDTLSLDELGKGKFNYTKGLFKNLAVTICIIIFSTLFSFLFRYIGFNESNIIMTYILGVLFVAKQTDGYFYSILASIIGVLTFNFFFTEPYYTFLTYNPDYPVTFIIMLVGALITSTSTVKARQEAKASSLREKRTLTLYQINKGLIKVRSVNQIAEFSVKYLVELFNRSVIIVIANSFGNLGEPYICSFNNDARVNIFKSFVETQAISKAFKTDKPVGFGTDMLVDSSAYYHPIKGQSGTLGVIGISCFDKNNLFEEQKVLLEAVTAQIALAIERERLWEEQQKAHLEVEAERIRGNLLRSISHDLRTPLTGILGASGTILDNEDVLDKKVIRELLKGVYEDASWLMSSVENILSMTRIDEGRIEINKNMEAVEEIVAEAVSRIKKLAKNHIIKVNIPNDLIMLPMDGTLIEQVLVNLLDNAIKYTPHGSTIEIKTLIENEWVIFEVSDNGKGISENNIPFVFDSFYTAATMNDSGRRGTGLGLAICKSIITAHGGEIWASNNRSGGATFKFLLPLKE